MVQRRKRYNFNFLNITPLVDVVFLLILFFILTSSFVQTPSIPVELPEASVVESTEPTDITITITSDGKVYVQDREVTPEQLGTELKRIIKPNITQNVNIRSDSTVYVGLLVTVIDKIRETGIRNISIITRTKE